MIGHLQKAHEYEIHRQLDHHPDASVREKNSLGRLRVTERCVSNTVQGHEEKICSGHNHGQRSDLSCRINSTLPVSTLINDKTKPALNPGAKIRSITESNVKKF